MRTTTWLWTMTTGLLTLGALPARAQQAPGAEQALLEQALEQPDPGRPGAQEDAPDLNYTVAVMLFGAGLVALLGWGVRRFGPRPAGLGGELGEDILVLETTALGEGHRVSLLQVRDRVLLVGMGQGAAPSALASWEQEREPAPAPAATDARAVARQAEREAASAAFERVRQDVEQQLALAEAHGEADRDDEEAAESIHEQRDGNRERDSVLVSLRSLEARHGGRRS